MRPLYLTNTLSRGKELFKPIHEGRVGMYVCGPTVYGDAHLGHARPGVTYDVLFRLLTYLGYKVRYVRNITDVGHLEHDADEGEDKIAKKARLEQLEPMEVAQYYTNRFHDAMRALNCLPPSIEPHATGHIIEQIQLVKEILANGYAYESQGSVYFDVEKYNESHHYGKLSGRNLTDVINNSRELDGQSEKHNQVDFALWKCAQPEHIMRWPSPWSAGFPGWHCECTAMGRKYLGNHFDIHGGGMDLVFPHHECEIAQAVASQGDDMVKYWMHCNMVTIRFFILQAHYRSTVDFSNEALQAAEKGLQRLMNAIADLKRITSSTESDAETHKVVTDLRQKCYDAMNDDLASPTVISHLFEAASTINRVLDHKGTISAADLEELSSTIHLFAEDILGLLPPSGGQGGGQAREEAFGHVVDMLLEQRAIAKANKDWATSDKIRNDLNALGFEIKDGKDGATWTLNK